MKLDTLNEASKLSPKEKRAVIQKGSLSKDAAFAIKGDLTNIIKKHIDKQWKRNSQFLDQGIQYEGEDIAAANKTIDTIIGDLYGYFVDAPMKERTQVKKSTRTVGQHKQEVYTVKPSKAAAQIEFFKVMDKPELGVLINIER